VKTLVRMQLSDPVVVEEALRAWPPAAKGGGRSRKDAAPLTAAEVSGWIDTEDPLLDALLAAAARAGRRLVVLRHVECSRAEVLAASHLEVLRKARIPDPQVDDRATRADMEAAPPRPTAEGWVVVLPQRLFLAPSALKEGGLAGVGEWTGEYVAGVRAAALLEGSGLTGLSLRPVYAPVKARRGGGAAGASLVQPGCRQLYSESILPPALLDRTAFTTRDDGPAGPRTPRRLGCLSYAAGALEGARDVSRTAEPWGPCGMPDWVVSARAREVIEGAKISGVAFRPVLVAGTPLHAEHRRRWERALDRLEAGGHEVVA